METIRETKRSRTVTLSVPSGDYSFLRSMTARMGWTIIPQSRRRKVEVRYPALDRAIEDVKKGNVMTFNDVDDMMQYLMSED